MMGFLFMVLKAVSIVFGICLAVSGCSAMVVILVLFIREFIKTMRRG